MTVSTSNYRNEYNGDCSTTCFAYTFKILEQSHLAVYVANALKTITADYTVTGVEAAGGGNIVLKTPPVLGELVVVERDVPFTQTTAYPEGGVFPAATHEKALDKLTMAIQAVKGLVLRSWRFAAGSPKASAGYVVDEPRAGMYPRVKADCSGIEFVALESCGTYANPVTTLGDLIRGNDCGAQERLARGPLGSSLRMWPTDKPDWTCGDVVLTNKTDASIAIRAVVSLDPNCDQAVIVNDGKACGRIYLVAPGSIGDDCRGFLVFSGGPVRATGSSISRGSYVRKASTSGFETTCVLHTDHRPVPKGAIGVAVEHAEGTVVAVLKFPTPSNGMQGLPTVRGNRSASTSGTPCTQVDLVAQRLVLADSCNDVVVVRNPASINNSICTSFTNKKNGRDNTESGGGFPAGDLHFYWVYEGQSGTLYSRSSTKGPDTSGPELPTCETNYAYSHSAYWDGNCLRRHTVRGATVYFDCTDSTRVLNAGAATCETRVSLVTVVPGIATRVHLRGEALNDTGGQANIVLGHRLNCLAMTINVRATSTDDFELTIPNINQEVFYRIDAASLALTLRVAGFDVPNGDS